MSRVIDACPCCGAPVRPQGASCAYCGSAFVVAADPPVASPVTMRAEKEILDSLFGGPTITAMHGATNPRERRRLYEGTFPLPEERAGEKIGAYLERRFRELARTGLSSAAVERFLVAEVGARETRRRRTR